MNLLAFDTSTEVMSIAVQRENRQIWSHDAPGGAQSSAQLIPQIQRLMALAGLRFDALHAIVFGQGPGSFTGLRTACSVAQGLAFAAHVPVLPVHNLLAVAEDARFNQVPHLADWQAQALLDARMNEMYAARYQYHDGFWLEISPTVLLQPESLQVDAACALVGNVFAVYGERLPMPASDAPQTAVRYAAWPSALALLRLAPAMLTRGAALCAKEALPLYIRDKVALTTRERAAKKDAL